MLVLLKKLSNALMFMMMSWLIGLLIFFSIVVVAMSEKEFNEMNLKVAINQVSELFPYFMLGIFLFWILIHFVVLIKVDKILDRVKRDGMKRK